MSFDAFEDARGHFLAFAVIRDGGFAWFEGMPVLPMRTAAGLERIPAIVSDELDELAGVHADLKGLGLRIRRFRQ